MWAVLAHELGSLTKEKKQKTKGRQAPAFTPLLPDCGCTVTSCFTVLPQVNPLCHDGPYHQTVSPKYALPSLSGFCQAFYHPS